MVGLYKHAQSMLKILLLLGSFCPLLTSLALADSLDNLSAELAGKREEVERLSEELRSKKQMHRDRINSLVQQKNEVEMALSRDEISLKSLLGKKEEFTRETSNHTVSNVSLVNKMKPLITDVKTYIATGIPFKNVERQQNLVALEEDLVSGKTSPEIIVSRFWNLLEGEISLQREIAEYQQLLVINKKEQLCEVVKVGMAGMFYRTPKGEVGRAVKGEDGYGFISFKQESEKKLVVALFDSVRKKIRSGYFTLPNFIDREGTVL